MLRYAGYDGTRTLVDPFCGSGTIVIEAAMIAAGLKPGALRNEFAFTRWGWLDRDGLPRPARRGPNAQPRAAGAEAKADPREAQRIVGRDTDERVLEIAARNAERAGVSDLVRFERADALTAAPPSGAGLVVTNPPYGERMELGAAGSFYRRLGENLKQNYPGCDVFLLSANRDAMKEIGLRVSSRRQLWNGGLDARLYEIRIFARE
ncbi:MAG: THUMP domain-containing class I SAM-dependent RNA methyltransferase [Spirochaetota bacterium]